MCISFVVLFMTQIHSLFTRSDNTIITHFSGIQVFEKYTTNKTIKVYPCIIFYFIN